VSWHNFQVTWRWRFIGWLLSILPWIAPRRAVCRENLIRGLALLAVELDKSCCFLPAFNHWTGEATRAARVAEKEA
jgi:hypothetical protein